LTLIVLGLTKRTKRRGRTLKAILTYRYMHNIHM